MQSLEALASSISLSKIKVPLVVILFLCFGRGQAQTLFAEIPLVKEVTSFDAISHGDSVLFSSEQFLNGKPVLTTRWIGRNGYSRVIDLPQPVSMIHSTGEKVYYYGIDGSKSQKVLTCFETAEGGKTQQLPTLTLPEGIVLGAFKEKNLFIVIYQRDGDLIRVQEVLGGTLVGEKKYAVAKDLRVWIRKESDVDFIEQNQTQLNTFKGARRVKLILDTDLYLVLDNHMDNETLVEVLAKDGSVTEYRYPVKSNEDFGSYVIDRKLFTTIMSNKQFELNVVELESRKLIANKVINNNELFDVIFRHARSKTVQKETIKNTMRAAPYGDPQLTVGYDSGRYFVSWGSYIDDNGGGVMAGANPLSLLATFVITTAIKQMSEGPGVSRQFFCSYNTEGFHQTRSKAYPRMRLDEYEMEQIAKGIKIKSKSYLPHGNGLMAIYHLQKEKTVRIVVFE